MRARLCVLLLYMWDSGVHINLCVRACLYVYVDVHACVCEYAFVCPVCVPVMRTRLSGSLLCQ